MSNFELSYITTKSPLYKEAVEIREQLFFKNMENSLDLINDDFELEGIHLVCLNEDEVIGTGRLNIEKEISMISQMAIKSSYQKQGIGAKILKELIRFSIEKGISKIELSARETAITFYEKFNFKPMGDKYPSNKTGIIHQSMVLKID
ncbi:GNAT family N-acetyltransferase [Flavivirga aquimarina]|uniref:GNAT family N-acetyltransferase n=1 Tax=Flavivirga aquimarina TaxID=2027862 RepID=A0ABT8WH61_9FLAO|nr:GNAT family N-acetyltransferase [Flavivirga aquimarina]MDO5972326.1 GNAT family N-acetyltransferase [Flavivirga aquimarina]